MREIALTVTAHHATLSHPGPARPARRPQTDRRKEGGWEAQPWAQPTEVDLFVCTVLRYQILSYFLCDPGFRWICALRFVWVPVSFVCLLSCVCLVVLSICCELCCEDPAVCVCRWLGRSLSAPYNKFIKDRTTRSQKSYYKVHSPLYTVFARSSATNIVLYVMSLLVRFSELVQRPPDDADAVALTSEERRAWLWEQLTSSKNLGIAFWITRAVVWLDLLVAST